MNKKNKCAWKSLEGCLCAEAEQQLQKAKEENEKLKYFANIYEQTYKRLYEIKDAQLKEPVNDMELEDLSIEELLDQVEETFTINDTTIENLTQQNKQMREALSWLETLLRENYNDKENQIICVVFAYEKIQQALNEVNNEK